MKKKKSNIKGITKIYKKEIELSEIDIQLNEEIHKDWYDGHPHHQPEIIKSGKGSWEGEAIPIKINDVIKTMEQLKKAGATYCEIMYHSDHCGYVFNGMEIKKSTAEEITEYGNNKIKREALEKEMEEIRKQYDAKHNELKKLFNERD